MKREEEEEKEETRAQSPVESGISRMGDDNVSRRYNASEENIYRGIIRNAQVAVSHTWRSFSVADGMVEENKNRDTVIA